MYLFLTKYKIRFKKQFRFRNNLSTIHALVNLVSLIKKYLDKDDFVRGISVDLQKVFDIVNHDILMPNLIIMVYVDWLIAG